MGNSIKNRKRISKIKDFTEPRGLYPECAWDYALVRKEILAGKWAPCFPGTEAGSGDPDLEECPICLLFYPGGLNRMICCKQSMCTECFLQVRPPPTPTNRAKCPFCKSEKFDAKYLGPLTPEQKKRLEAEQKRVMELQARREEEQSKAEERRSVHEEPREIVSIASTASLPSTLSASQLLDKKHEKKEHLARAHSYSTSSQSPPEEPESNELGVDPGVAGSGVGEEDLADIEDQMLEEALRVSLLESKRLEAAAAAGAEGKNTGSEFDSTRLVHPAPDATITTATQEVAAPESSDDAAGAAAAVAPVDDQDLEEEDLLNQAILLSLAPSQTE